MSKTSVVVESVPTDKLLCIWEKVYDESSCKSPFLHINWIRSWLLAIDSKPLTALFLLNGEIKGIAIIGLESKDYILFRVQTAYLNQTGNFKYDQSWIEYNDLLCPSQHKSIFFNLLLEELKKINITQLKTSMTSASFGEFLNTHSILYNDVSISKGFKTKLDDVVSSPRKIFSKNTSSQIKRSIRILESKFGKLVLSKCFSSTDIATSFEQLAALHRAKWSPSQHGSGFDNDVFVKQHAALLYSMPNFAELLKFKAGDKILGYSLNFKLGNTVYFYCSGLTADNSDNKVKIGYVMHYLIMKHYQGEGFQNYDFLGGESRYKRSLSNVEVLFFSESFVFSSLKGKLLSIYKMIRRLA